jgi:cytochrome c-type biogenesis protein CcmH/NrfG
VKHALVVLIMLCSAATIASAAPPATTPGTTTPAATKAAVHPAAVPAAVKPTEVDSLGLLEKAVARDSSKTDNLYRLGVMYLDRDRPAEAITVLDKVYAKRPKDLRVLVNLGAAHDARGHGDLAQRLYREALEVAPGDSVASCRLASSLYAGGKQPEAIDLLRSVIEHSPRSFCAYFTLGVAFADAGIYRDAIRMWQKVVELAPTSPEAISAQESIAVLQKFVQ